MSRSHVSLPALDVEREQQEINSLITTLQQFKPASRSNKEPSSSNSAALTPKTGPSRTGRGRPPKKDVPSSPVVPDGDSLCANSVELIIECLNKLNAQNQKLSNQVNELHTIVIEQNKTIESLNSKIESRPETDQPPSSVVSPDLGNEIFDTVVKRVEKIEQNINSHLLICRGPAVTSKIVSSTVNGAVDVEKVKAEICSEVCGDTIARVSVTALGVSVYGKDKKH